jgi:hypothetical protein
VAQRQLSGSGGMNAWVQWSQFESFANASLSVGALDSASRGVYWLSRGFLFA